MGNSNEPRLGGDDFGSVAGGEVGGDVATEAIWFAGRFANSEKFDAVYREGMSLVERTAQYLDGPGRAEAKSLAAPVTLVYATESMRLTTRLLEIASWLMIYRAVKDGEIDAGVARQRRRKLRLKQIGRPQHVKHYELLPIGLRQLIEASFSFNDRIVQLDKAMNEGRTDAAQLSAPNPVIQQLQQLEAAFGPR